MEAFIKADIFFFVTTIAIVVLTLLFALLLVYGISFSRNLYLLSKDIKREADAVLNVIGKVRVAVEDKGVNILGMAAKVFNAVQEYKKPRKRKTKNKSAKNK